MSTIRTVLLCAILVAASLFVFGSVLGLRDTRQETRSRLIHEDHERRMRQSHEESARVRRELEESRRQQQHLWEEHERLQRRAIEGR
jgi:sensor histidine kinase YesM